MSRRAIRYLGTKAGRHPYLALLAALVLTGLAVWAAFKRFNVEMDVASLLPADSKMAQATRKPLSDFVGHGFLLCVLEVKDSAPDEIRENPVDFLKSIKTEVERALDDTRFFSKRTDRVTQRELGFGGNDAALVSLFRDQDFDRLEQFAVPSVLNRQVQELSSELGENPTTETLNQARRDPFGLDQMLSQRSDILAGPLQSNLRQGFHLSQDGEMMLLVLWPVESSTDLLFVRKLRQFLEATREGLYKRNDGDDGGVDWRDAVSIEFTGSHVESAEGARSVKQDIFFTSTVSFVSVIILFVVAFRQPEALLFVAVPLIIGVAWTLGVTSLFVDRITQVTLTFAAILIGLGIDFSIHLYNRFLEDMRLGKTPQSSLRNAITHTGPSIVAGAITTGFAFFGMMLTRFVGFRELGFFGGVGILMSLLGVAVVLPALMMIFSGMSRKVRAPVATLGLKKITFTVQAYPRMTVAAGLCIVVFLGLHARGVTFNDDFRNLRQPSDSYVRMLDRIERHFELPSNQVFVIVEDEDLRAALRKNDEIYRKIQATQDTYDLVAVDSLRLIYPSPETQLFNLQRIRQFPTETVSEQLRSRVSSMENLPQDFFASFIERLEEIQAESRTAVERQQPVIGMRRVDDRTFQELVQNYVYHTAPEDEDDPGVYRVITRVYPPADEWIDEVPGPFIDRLSSDIDPAPVILGNAILASELKDYIIGDLTLVVLVVFVCVTIYLIFYFRSILRAMLAMVPVMFAILTMLGVMHFLGMRLNYLNIIAIPMIVGISVDSGIHLLGRFYEGDGHNMRLAIEKTGRAIVITSLTTIFGFGSLSLASFQGIREIGILSIIGTVATLFAALVFLPAILRLLDPKYTYRGGEGDEIG